MASAIGLTETSPQMDWTRDAKIYDHYLNWKTKVELIFNSVLSKATAVQKSSYLQLWMGDPGIPLIRQWENTGQISFENAKATEGHEISNGYKLETFWNLLDEELKPKGNKLLSVIELWTQSKQGSKSLNEWLTHVHNLAELCDYPAASKERIIRDVLIINCSNEKAKDKIIWKYHEIKLEEVIGILQTEDSTQRTLQEMNWANQETSLCKLWQEKVWKQRKQEEEFQQSSTQKFWFFFTEFSIYQFRKTVLSMQETIPSGTWSSLQSQNSQVQWLWRNWSLQELL